MDLWRHTPQWALEILIEQLEAVEAGRLQQVIQGASFPYLKDHDRRAVSRELAALTAPRGAPDPNAFTPELFNDLDAAAAYFERLGIEVKRVSTA
jgi:hypothetical protein